jgi:hypothetical protein
MAMNIRIGAFHSMRTSMSSSWSGSSRRSSRILGDETTLGGLALREFLKMILKIDRFQKLLRRYG